MLQCIWLEDRIHTRLTLNFYQSGSWRIENERSQAPSAQEILHRYVSLGRKDAIMPAFESLLRYVDEVIPIERADVLRASEIVQHPRGVAARDALHIATAI